MSQPNNQRTEIMNTKNQAFAQWIDRLIDEKDIDREHLLEPVGESGINYIPVDCLITEFKRIPDSEQARLKDSLVRLDFANGDFLRYFTHLATAMAV